MSVLYPIPADYLPISDAWARARANYPRDAYGRLAGMLVQGVLQAWLCDRSGAITVLDPTFWSNPQAAQKAILKQEVRTRPVTMRSSGSEGRPVILQKDLDERLPTFAQQMDAVAKSRRALKTAPIATADGVDKGGEKARYDEVGFLIEAFRLIYEGKEPPANQADLIRQTLDAYQQRGLKGGTPSEEWPKVMVRRLWKELGLERRAGPIRRNR